MKSNRRLFAVTLLGVALSLSPSFATPPTVADLQRGAAAMSNALAKALPFNSTVGLNWSDAYIGQFVSLPPHFGFGIVGGATSINSSDVTALLKTLGYDTSSLGNTLPLPALAAEGRIGGFILPFDIGLKAGFIPQAAGEALSSAAGGLNVDYLLLGADVRYALVKGNLVLPKVSIGVGLNYMSGGVSKSVGSDQSFAFGTDTIKAQAPTIGIDWKTTTLDFKAQVSKSFLIFTPYLGLGAAYGMSHAGYSVKSTVLYNGTAINQTQINSINAYLQSLGIAPMDITASGISSYYDVNAWAIRAFGGLSLNMFVIRMDLTGLYNISDGSYGGTLGVRFQL